MPSLRDPFEHTFEKGGFTYVSWSQVADRLDEAAPGWSFTIRQLGEDWCWGQLKIGEQTYENVGYAENASADWKKEALKDAVSDALKRCAAMAGVARYLYDKEAPSTGRQNGHSAPARTQPVAVAARSSTDVPDDLDWDSLSPVKPAALRNPPTSGGMSYQELADRAKAGGKEIKDIAEVSKRMYGKDAWKLVSLTAEQRFAVAEEAGLL